MPMNRSCRAYQRRAQRARVQFHAELRSPGSIRVALSTLVVMVAVMAAYWQAGVGRCARRTGSADVARARGAHDRAAVTLIG
jgi:hypothetical protein